MGGTYLFLGGFLSFGVVGGDWGDKGVEVVGGKVGVFRLWWVGGWVGGWVSCFSWARKEEENEAVRMRCSGCMGVGGWLGR